MKRLVYLIILILSLNIASAAILHGTIYDINFKKLNDVIVQVNTTPTQRFVSKEGQYSFALDLGSYEITAVYELPNHVLLYTTQNISIERDGYYVNDLFLKVTNPKNIPYETKEENKIKAWLSSYVWLILIASVLVVLFAMLYSKNRVYKKIEKKLVETGASDKYLKDVLRIIKEEGGRTTQKEIRKKIPLSEAKISLMITELENKGILKRIKKGRGNIIVLGKE